MQQPIYSVHLYCVSDNDRILERDLLRSPEIANGRIPISIIRGATAASAAYDDAIKNAEADILVFAHQDIYFPEGWFMRLQMACEQLNSMDPAWAVAGVLGVTREHRFVGHLWDSALGFVIGGPFDFPQEIASLDEVVLIVRRSSGISFDPALPTFHLYGTDIVLAALRSEMKSYAVDLPVIHNTKWGYWLGRNYISGYRFMVHKWKSLLPWPTVILPLTQNPFVFLFRQLRLLYRAVCRSSTIHPPLDRPDVKAQELGFVRYRCGEVDGRSIDGSRVSSKEAEHI